MIFTCHGFLHGNINSVNIADISDVEDKCITCSISTFSHEFVHPSCSECVLDLKAGVSDIIDILVAKIFQSCCCPLVDCHDISLITFLSPKSLAISWYHFHVFFQSTYLPFTSLSTTRPILKHLLEGSICSVLIKKLHPQDIFAHYYPNASLNEQLSNLVAAKKGVRK